MSSGDGRGQAASGTFGAATRAVMPQDDVVRLLLLRHGEVQGFEQRLVRGQIDLALSRTGRAQHAALVDWLLHHGPRIDAVVTSDLVRCRDLGERLARATGAPLEVAPALREQSMGAWEGLPWDEVTRREGAAINAYWADYFQAAPRGGESMAAMFARVAAWWHARRASYVGRTVAIATHIGPLRAFLCELLGRPGTEALRFAPAVASCTEVLVSTPGAVVDTLGERPWLADAAALAALREDTLRALGRATAGTLDPVDTAESWGKEDYALRLACIESWLLERIREWASGAGNGAGSGAGGAQAPRGSQTEALFAALEELREARQWTDTPINKPLAIERLLWRLIPAASSRRPG